MLEMEGFKGAGGVLFRAHLKALPGLEPIRRLDANIYIMFVCFSDIFMSKRRFPEKGEPPSMLGPTFIYFNAEI